MKLNLGAHENAHKMGQGYAVHQMLLSPIKTFLKTIVYNELTVTGFNASTIFLYSIYGRAQDLAIESTLQQQSHISNENIWNNGAILETYHMKGW